MPNRSVTLLSLALTMLLASWTRAQVPATRPVAIFKGDRLPVPPQQPGAWSPPRTQLPPKVIEAARLLFSQGVADPRGGEYREIDVAVGDVWTGGGEPVPTHGWVFPAEAKATQRFAVCWNGLVYPVVTLGAPANLKQDIDAAIASDKQMMVTRGKAGAPFKASRFVGAIREEQAVSCQTLTGIKVCLLLRVGESELAEKYWAELGMNPAKDPHQPDDPYLSLASEWAWCAFDRAVCAHMRGDDVVSMETARLLSQAAREIDQAAAKRGFQRPQVEDPAHRNQYQHTGPYLGFLAPLTPLLADEERRVTEDPKPLPLEQARKIPGKPQRIAALIDDFEEIAERQWGQPGGVGVDASPIVVAIEKEGQDAVEPLIDCLKADRRLTRSVSFGRDFATGRNLIPVVEAAYLAIGNILQTHDFGPASDAFIRGGKPDRAAMVAEVQAFWAKSKGKTPADLWYQTLADDSAGPHRWLEAAGHIVQPTDVEVRGGWVSEPQRAPGQKPILRGESLRGKRNPSVAELMARRIPQMDSADKTSSMAVFLTHDATDVALYLNRWDPKSAAPALKAQIDACQAAIDYWKRYSDVSMLTRDIGRLREALAATGNEDSLKEYAAWIRQQKPERSQFEVVKMFATMYEHPANSDIASAAEWLFNDPASPWHCLATAKNYQALGPHNDPIASPLICVPAFRKSVLSNLSDDAEIGFVSPRNGMLAITMNGESGLSYGISDVKDPLLPKENDRRPLRVADWYAWHVSNLDGSPEFEMYWPTEKKDAAIAEMKSFLQRWSARFAATEMQKSLGRAEFDRTPFTLPKLERPATQAQADAGEAIFSLAGKGEVRVVPLAPFPTKAKWVALKQFPQHLEGFDTKAGKPVVIDSFDQDGLVWQAEEVQEAGKWHRYYGFVGHHIIAKVPAEEIQLFKDIPPWDPRTP